MASRTPTTPELNAKGKIFLQHLGGFLSSRAAEDHLVRLGARDVVAPEKIFAGDGAAEVKRVLRGVYAGTADSDILLAPSGMNALHAAFRAISTLQAPRGRTAWVQLGGWLYLDSIALLKKFTPNPAQDYLRHGDVTDLAGLEKLFAEHGARIAGMVIEAPTNPLIQTPDVPAVAAPWPGRHGVKLILDPAISSPFNVDLLPYADLVAQSLTKYTAHEGDVIAGAVVVNPAGPDADALRRLAASWLEPVHPRDLARLAAQLGGAEAIIARMNASTLQVATFLENHPAVQQVWWALQPSTSKRQLPEDRPHAALRRRHDFVHAERFAQAGEFLRPRAPAQGPELRDADHLAFAVHLPRPL